MDVRSEEIRTAITTWGAQRTYFASLTHSHTSKMSIALQHKLLTYSWGRMFSGREGRKLAAALGGPLRPPPGVRKKRPANLLKLITPDKKWIPQKPFSIRSHDRTWSHEHGFHLHLHCLLFLHTVVDEARVLKLIKERWIECLKLTLVTFKQLARRAIEQGDPTKAQREHRNETGRVVVEYGCALLDGEKFCTCSACEVASRCQKVFGSQLIQRPSSFRPHLKKPQSLERVLRAKYPRTSALVLKQFIRRGAVAMKGQIVRDPGAWVPPGVDVHVKPSLQDSARKLQRRLKDFTYDLADLSEEHGVHVEQVRTAARIPRYLVKLGCELSGMMNKLGRVADNGITYYGLWELSNIAVDRNHPKNAPARGAWRSLYRATYGTQTITWSQEARAEFGLDEERPDQSIEQDTPTADEDTRMIGYIDGKVWDSIAKTERQDLLAFLYRAHAAGTLEQVSWITPLPEGSMHGMFRAVEPKKIELKPEWWQVWQGEKEAAARGRAPPKPPPERTAASMEARHLQREELQHQMHDWGIRLGRRTACAENVRPPDEPSEGAAE